MNKRKVGQEKEKMACRYLEEKGFEICSVNFWCRFGEIDIIAKDGEYLVFVEVKYRRTAECGGSLYAVSPLKKHRICECARYYLYRKRLPSETAVRFDVVCIEGNQILHIEHAFEVQ